MKLIHLYCLFFIINLPVNGQSSCTGILENYIRLGLRENLAMKQEALEIGVVMETLRQARSLFYPRVAFNPTYSLAAGGRRLEFPVGDMLNPAYRTLNQLTGSENFPANIGNINELLAPNNFHDTRITFTHAIFNTDVRYNYLIQKDLLSAREARRLVIENELRYHITAAYFQYLQTLDMVRIYENSRNVMTALTRLNEKLVASHAATGEAVTTARYEVSKIDNQLAAARRDRETARAYMNFLLNVDLSAPVEVDSSLMQELTETGPAEILQQTALASRQELVVLGKSLHAAQTAVKLNEANAAIPNIYLGGSTGFQGFGYSFKNQGYYALQFGLKWDLFTGQEKHSKIQQAKIRTHILQTQLTDTEKQIQLQVLQAYYALEAAKESVAATQSGITHAALVFRIVDSKYRNGQALLIEFLRFQNEYQTVQYQHSLAKTDLLVKRAALDKAIALH